MAGAVPAGMVNKPAGLIVRPVMPPSAVIEGVTSVVRKAAPFNVSLVYTVAVVPPVALFIGAAEKSSSLATIAAAVTTTVTLAVSQFVGLRASQI